MTEAEALDMAARAAGWLDGWGGKDAGPFAHLFGSDSIRAHAATIMENAALKAENERLREALEDIRHQASTRITDGDEMGARIWRIALVDTLAEATAALKEIEGD